MNDLKDTYNKNYCTKNYFGYREKIYSPLIGALIRKSGIKTGSTILDCGCGQGFFTYLFNKKGLMAYGIDISHNGIKQAKQAYGMHGIEFVVGNMSTNPFKVKFDCVFTRSFSPYNTHEFKHQTIITDDLLRNVKENGKYIFVYNTNFKHNKKGTSWIFHNLMDVKEHFAKYIKPQVYFTSRLDTMILGKYAFNRIFTMINIKMSKILGIGGELICIIRK